MTNLRNRIVITICGTVLLIANTSLSGYQRLASRTATDPISIVCRNDENGKALVEIALPEHQQFENCRYQIWPHFVGADGKHLQSFSRETNEALRHPTLRQFSCGIFHQEVGDAVRLSSNAVVDLLSEASIRGGASLTSFDLRVFYLTPAGIEKSVGAQGIVCPVVR